MATDLRSPLKLNGNPITGVGTPSNPTDAATKQYVDNVAAGLDPKPSVRAATTANITLSGAQTIDGVSVVAGDRVLVKNQSTASANGIYVAAAGAWSRTPDASQGTLSPGALVIVEEGSANADTIWLLTNDGAITVGTTAITWTRFQAGVTYTFGDGLQITASTVSVKAGAGLLVDGTSLRVDPSYSGFAKRYAATITSTATTVAITHNLGTLDVVPALYDISNGSARVLVDADVVVTDANTLQLTFGTAPTNGQYRILILA
jgi:hypothetical protein